MLYFPQVCSHIVQAIRKETLRVQEEWETSLTVPPKASKATTSDNRFVQLTHQRDDCKGSQVQNI